MENAGNSNDSGVAGAIGSHASAMEWPGQEGRKYRLSAECALEKLTSGKKNIN